MLVVNLSSGKTRRYDLLNPEDASRWSKDAGAESFQQTIKAVSILLRGEQRVIKAPIGAGRCRFGAELFVETRAGKKLQGKPTGIVATLQAGEIRLTVLAYFNDRPKITTVSLAKIGTQRFVPKRSDKWD